MNEVKIHQQIAAFHPTTHVAALFFVFFLIIFRVFVTFILRGCKSNCCMLKIFRKGQRCQSVHRAKVTTLTCFVGFDTFK